MLLYVISTLSPFIAVTLFLFFLFLFFWVITFTSSFYRHYHRIIHCLLPYLVTFSFSSPLQLDLEKTKEKPIYQDYKFLTREEIEHLGIEKMIGTSYLR